MPHVTLLYTRHSSETTSKKARYHDHLHDMCYVILLRKFPCKSPKQARYPDAVNDICYTTLLKTIQQKYRKNETATTMRSQTSRVRDLNQTFCIQKSRDMHICSLIPNICSWYLMLIFMFTLTETHLVHSFTSEPRNYTSLCLQTFATDLDAMTCLISKQKVWVQDHTLSLSDTRPNNSIVVWSQPWCSAHHRKQLYCCCIAF